MTKFRPCIDLHSGQVKQIVGGMLTEKNANLKTNHVSSHPAGYFATLYKEHGLTGGHMIMLGPGNKEVAKEALQAWPAGLQVGGGIKDSNAREWIEAGAEKVIMTSFLFPDGKYSQDRLESTLEALDQDRDKLVIDLSCRRTETSWYVAMNKWQTITEFEVNADNIRKLEQHCSEFLIHAADVEGLQQGIDEDLVRKLSEWCTVPVTYAGGAKSVEDLHRVKELSNGKVDLTIGSALDVFGGKLVSFDECVKFNQEQPT